MLPNQPAFVYSLISGFEAGFQFTTVSSTLTNTPHSADGITLFRIIARFEQFALEFNVKRTYTPAHENTESPAGRFFHLINTPARTTDPPPLSSSASDRGADLSPDSCWSEQVRVDSPVSETTDHRPCTYPYQVRRELKRVDPSVN